jgi:TetR/AcrR family transcriptional regulator, regulator of cefoperazone and chloramphenicol sensitivity
MTDTSTSTSHPTTKQRLLDAARAVFAEKGFEAASVGEICDRADANRAAISFHFGGKERLYIECVKDAHRRINQEFPVPQWAPSTPADVRLAGFMRTLILRMFHDPDTFCAELMVREMAHPSGACAEVVSEFIRPMADELMSILAELLPAGVPEERRYLLGFSLVSQCLFYKQCRPVAALLMGEERFAALDVERVAAHVTDVARAAVAAVARANADAGTNP